MVSRAPDLERDAEPFAPGTSPFRMKGLVYKDMLAAIGADGPSAWKGVRAALANDALRAFYDQLFLASSWYDAFPILPLTHAVAKVRGRSFEDVARERTRSQAEQDIRGAYKLLLKVASPELVATRLPRVTARYFDFGETHVQKMASGVVEILRTGMPGRLAHWYGIVSEVYMVHALATAGAASPRVRIQMQGQDGERLGVVTMAMRFTVSWTPRSG